MESSITERLAAILEDIDEGIAELQSADDASGALVFLKSAKQGLEEFIHDIELLNAENV
ncbi:MAG: hypothetical protein FWC97_00455 [Treponema sp.]|nr:hypothetical protein [Treponema sp.]